MISKETLRSIVKSQKQELSSFGYGIAREVAGEIDLNLPFAIVISGIRRCGKSTLLHQIMNQKEPFHYFNFEDPRATGFDIGDFQNLDEVFSEEYGKSEFYFFDELQNVPKWELFIRTMLDRKKHFLITGSNASLLSKELGTRLTGRHLKHELFPFSYSEFLLFSSKKAGPDSFAEYFMKGGFPEYLKYGKVEILQELLRDIIARDIVMRHGLRSPKTMTEMALYLITNVGKEFSYGGLAKAFGLGSTNSAIDFVSYLEDAYILFTVPKFDYSLKKQQINQKKVYSIDNGLSSCNSVSFSSDSGRMLENQVFLDLRRLRSEIYYFSGSNECDFVVREKNRIKMAVQVCHELNEGNMDREINGLVEALETFNLDEGLLLTYDQEDNLERSGKRIIVKPVWKWSSKTRKK